MKKKTTLVVSVLIVLACLMGCDPGLPVPDPNPIPLPVLQWVSGNLTIGISQDPFGKLFGAEGSYLYEFTYSGGKIMYKDLPVTKPHDGTVDSTNDNYSSFDNFKTEVYINHGSFIISDATYTFKNN